MRISGNAGTILALHFLLISIVLASGKRTKGNISFTFRICALKQKYYFPYIGSFSFFLLCFKILIGTTSIISRLDEHFKRESVKSPKILGNLRFQHLSEKIYNVGTRRSNFWVILFQRIVVRPPPLYNLAQNILFQQSTEAP